MKIMRFLKLNKIAALCALCTMCVVICLSAVVIVSSGANGHGDLPPSEAPSVIQPSSSNPTLDYQGFPGPGTRIDRRAGNWSDDGNRAPSFAGGSGLSNAPFLINTAAQMGLMAHNVMNNIGGAASAHFQIIANIDLGAHNWVSRIGSSRLVSAQYIADGVANGTARPYDQWWHTPASLPVPAQFTGTLSAAIDPVTQQGFVVQNLHQVVFGNTGTHFWGGHNPGYVGNAGLFYHTGAGATFRDLTFENAFISSAGHGLEVLMRSIFLLSGCLRLIT